MDIRKLNIKKQILDKFAAGHTTSNTISQNDAKKVEHIIFPIVLVWKLFKLNRCTEN